MTFYGTTTKIGIGCSNFSVHQISMQSDNVFAFFSWARWAALANQPQQKELHVIGN